MSGGGVATTPVNTRVKRLKVKYGKTSIKIQKTTPEEPPLGAAECLLDAGRVVVRHGVAFVRLETTGAEEEETLHRRLQ